MTHIEAFHSTRGGYDFLSLRRADRGDYEIVYDDGVARRMVWRVATRDATPKRIGEALRLAVEDLRVVPALHAELKRRAIAIEAIR